MTFSPLPESYRDALAEVKASREALKKQAKEIAELKADFLKTHNWLCDRNEELAALRAVADEMAEALEYNQLDTEGYCIECVDSPKTHELDCRIGKALAHYKEL